MNLSVSLRTSPHPLAGGGLIRRHRFKPANRGRQIRCSNTTDTNADINADIKERVKNAVRGVGLRSDVTPEVWLGDRFVLSASLLNDCSNSVPEGSRDTLLSIVLCRTETLKNGGNVTWPSEKVTELWKVCYCAFYKLCEPCLSSAAACAPCYVMLTSVLDTSMASSCLCIL